MSDCAEVLFISDDTGVVQCVDPRIGTVFINYRGLSAVKKNTMVIIGKDYLLAADANKPILQIWPLNSQEPVGGPKIVLSGKASALSISPDGFHCVGSIDAKLYVYQVSSGSLLAVLSKHYRGITKILFMDDSSHFVSCGENGTVLVWNLATAVSREGAGTIADVSFQQEPVYSFSHHSLKVTDAFVGPGSMKARLYTVSIDQTCKVYDLKSGTLILSVVFESSLTAVVPNAIESVLFVGTTKGEIIEFSLDPLPRSLDHTVREAEVQKKFIGHEKLVSSIDVSVDGYLLVSGSDDGKVIVWDIPSRQLLRVFTLKGPAASVFLSLASNNIFTDNFVASSVFQNLKRVSDEEKWFDVNVIVNETLSCLDYSEPEPIVVETSESNQEEVEQLKIALNQALKKNKELYQFAMEKVLDDPHRFQAKKKKKTVE